jgi:sulfur-oxidizing protein SoxY
MAVPSSLQQQKGRLAGDLLRDFRGKQATPSSDIHISAPYIAEDGASVFLEVFTTLPQVDGFVVFADRNPEQLVAAFWLGPNTLPEIKTRIKMAQSSNIWVMARSQGQYFSAHRAVKVTVGGCGLGQN